MRIIAGALGGRTFDSPGTRRTHPMSDKMRGALFNILGELDGLDVLDAFGGSGALALEAYSRGAQSVLVLENDRTAQKTIARNIRALLAAQHVRLAQASVSAWLSTNPETAFNVILCDPPYDDVQPNTLHALTQRLRPGGIYVLSYPAAQEPPNFSSLEQVKQQSYGDAQLVFYAAR